MQPIPHQTPSIGSISGSIETIDAILPAGGRLQGDFAQMAGVTVKALIDFNGETILRRTIATLRATGRIGRIVVIGPAEVLQEAQAAGADGLVAEGDSGPDNILRGLEWLNKGQGEGREVRSQKSEDRRQSDDLGTRNTELSSPTPYTQAPIPSTRVLIATTDLPFLTPDALNTFLDACPPEADAVIPLLTEQEFAGRFPGTQNEYVRLKDGSFTMGCTFLVNGEALLRNRAHLEGLFAARKSQWQMAKLIGLGTVLRFATRQLTVAQLQARASAISQCRGVAISHMPAELAYDIDQVSEYVYAKEHALTAVSSSPPETVPAPTIAALPSKETVR